MGYHTTRIYKFDPTLPRLGKKEFSTILVTEKLFRKAKKENPEFKDMTWNQFQEIWDIISKEIQDEVFDNSLGIKLPFFLGDLKIQYLPYKMENVGDRAISAELGERIPYVNLHSKGKEGKLVWERKGARRFNKALDLFAFETNELFRIGVVKALKKNPDKFRISRVRISKKKT